MSEGTMSTDLNVYAGEALVGTITKDEYDTFIKAAYKETRFAEIAYCVWFCARCVMALIYQSVANLVVGLAGVAIVVSFTSPGFLVSVFNAEDFGKSFDPALGMCFVISLTLTATFGWGLDRRRILTPTPRQRLLARAMQARFNIPDASRISICRS